MEFSTARLIVRPFVMTDAADVYEYASDAATTERAGWAAHASRADSEHALANWIEDGCRHAIVCKADGKVIGHIAVYPDSEEGRADTRELGFALNRRYQNRGLMTEAVGETVRRLFADGVVYVWACCFAGNEASRRVIEKCGFAFQQNGEYFSESLGQMFSSLEYRIEKP